MLYCTNINRKKQLWLGAITQKEVEDNKKKDNKFK